MKHGEGQVRRWSPVKKKDKVGCWGRFFETLVGESFVLFCVGCFLGGHEWGFAGPRVHMGAADTN